MFIEVTINCLHKRQTVANCIVRAQGVKIMYEKSFWEDLLFLLLFIYCFAYHSRQQQQQLSHPLFCCMKWLEFTCCLFSSFNEHTIISINYIVHCRSRTPFQCCCLSDQLATYSLYILVHSPNSDTWV